MLVRYLVRGSGEKDANVVTSLFVGDGSLPDLLVNPRELLLTEDVDAALLASRENKSAGKFLTELGRKNDPALLIQTRRVCPQEHIPTTPLLSEAEQPPRCHYPLTRSTLLHFSPQSTRRNELSGNWRINFRGIPGLSPGVGSGGRIAASGSATPAGVPEWPLNNDDPPERVIV